MLRTEVGKLAQAQLRTKAFFGSGVVALSSAGDADAPPSPGTMSGGTKACGTVAQHRKFIARCSQQVSPEVRESVLERLQLQLVADRDAYDLGAFCFRAPSARGASATPGSPGSMPGAPGRSAGRLKSSATSEE